MLKNEKKGITLVALVITIVILLILAGISISTLTNTGIFGKVEEAKRTTENAEREQEQTLDEYERELNKYSSDELTMANANIVLSETENTELHDKNGNKIVVPAGFKVIVNNDTDNAITVEKGIVIEDEKENQYVWIPCTTEDSKIKLQYKRTEWDVEDDNGAIASKDEMTLENSKCSDYDIENGLTEQRVAEIVDQVKTEIESVRKYGGYYIGRYEVGNEKDVAVIKYNQIPYASVKWSEGYSLAKGIGGGPKATTYLCSSYAWDTAINFIQNNGAKNYSTLWENFNENFFDNEVKDSNGNVIKIEKESKVLETGKTTPKSNIYDMGGNMVEYTTEVIPENEKSIILRGGSFVYRAASGHRVSFFSGGQYQDYGFRATLFIK